MHAFVSGATFEWVKKRVCWQELRVRTLFCSLPEVLNFRTGIPSWSGRIKEMFFIPSRTKKPGIDTKLDEVSRCKVSFANRGYCRLPLPGAKDDLCNDWEFLGTLFCLLPACDGFILLPLCCWSWFGPFLFGMIVHSVLRQHSLVSSFFVVQWCHLMLLVSQSPKPLWFFNFPD